jgi:phosphosulfolactate synthase (CoM biosynthesis protein A)
VSAPGGTAFAFLPLPRRPAKPRSQGRTEIRGPYSWPMGPRHLADILDIAGGYVDALKFPGGSFTLMPRTTVVEMITIAHAAGVQVSTGGFLEWVLHKDPALVPRYLAEAQDLGFDIIEVSTGFLTIRADDVVRLVADIAATGLQPQPEITVKPGAGAYLVTNRRLAEAGTTLSGPAIALANRCLDAGAVHVMVESEGITEQVDTWNLDVIPHLVDGIGLDRLIFEAADPDVFDWYLRHYGPDVNLFVDHSHALLLEAHRLGTWSDNLTWGRTVTYPDPLLANATP